ncbi:MAG: GNAT family N-acetyltransferase [Chloroflexota bacterium]|nr:GNAT family N-acetyltransferase [Chloroflexota bacterium]
MYTLGPSEYAQAKPLVQAMEYHLAIAAIFDRTAPAKIYVDHPTHPHAALISTRRRFYLAGSEDDDEFNAAVGRLFAEIIFPQARQAGEPLLVLYYAPDRWEKVINARWKDKFPNKRQRQYYTFDHLKNDWRTMLPKDYSLRCIDQALVDTQHLKNLDRLTSEMRAERASAEDFLRAGFGVCLIHGDEVAGWCLSEYNCAGSCEVGIETIEAYQKRGFATLMASALIEQALSRGISRIGWDCYADNAPSVATARRVGFRKVDDYFVYVAWLNANDRQN